MPAPSSLVDWDTNGTHTTPVTSGHASDGFAHDEVPASDEINKLLMLIGQWVRWFSVGGGPRNHKVSAALGEVVHTAAEPTGGWFNISGEFFINDNADVLVIPINLPSGTTITKIGAYVREDGFGFKWDMKAWKYDTSTIGSPTQLGTTQTGSGSNAVKQLAVSGLTEVVPSDDSTVYFVTLSRNTGTVGVNDRVLSGFAEYQPYSP